MKKLKNLVIYIVIALLCVVAVASLIQNKNLKSAGNPEAYATAGQNPSPILQDSSQTPQQSQSSTPAANEVYSAPILPTSDGNHISSRSQEENQAHLQQVMSKETEELNPNPVVGIGQGSDYASVTREAVANAGGLADIITEGDIVLIKPNLCVQTEPAGSPMTTDYRVVQEVVNMAYECGASRVIIAEGNFSSNAFTNKKNKYVEVVGAELYNFNDCVKEDCYELQPQKSLVGRGLFIPKIYMDADVVIDVAKLKTHFITKVTLGLKNCIGVPSYKIYGSAGDKSGLHSLGIESVIIDINKIRKPDFTIIDGIVGGEKYGPYANTPVESNIILAGRDIVAVDAVGLTFMGFEVDKVSHVKLAAEEKLGICDLTAIQVVGADLDAIKMKFIPAKTY